MIIDKPDVYRIKIDNQYDYCRDSWLEQGWTVHDVIGTTPSTLPDGPINFAQKSGRPAPKPTVEFTDTEKAVFYSHYNLWQKCVDLNQPMIIIEDDCVLTRQMSKVWKVWSLKYFCKVTKGFAPAAGYLITPLGALRAIECVTGQEMIFNVDHYIKQMRDPNPTEWAIDFATDIDKQNKSIVHL